jgi:fructose-bisphosphate aldolase class II
LQQNKEGGLDEDRIRAIETITDVPLVIHGGSGVPTDQRKRLAQTTKICKFNIGTELRIAFGASLRAALAGDVDSFDRVQILKQVEPDIQTAARRVLRGLAAD